MRILEVVVPELILIRHGQSVVNDARLEGGVDSEKAEALTAQYGGAEPLSPLGELQAGTACKVLGSMIDADEMRPEVGLVSTLPRAIDTSKIIGPPGVEYEEFSDLREFDGGHNDELREDVQSVEERVFGVLINAMEKNEDKGLIVITHRGVMGVVLGMILGVRGREELAQIRREALDRATPQNCEFDHFRREGNKVLYRSVRPWSQNKAKELSVRGNPESRWVRVGHKALHRFD